MCFFFGEKKFLDIVLEGFIICIRINCCFFKWYILFFEKIKVLIKICRFIILGIFLVD